MLLRSVCDFGGVWLECRKKNEGRERERGYLDVGSFSFAESIANFEESEPLLERSIQEQRSVPSCVLSILFNQKVPRTFLNHRLHVFCLPIRGWPGSGSSFASTSVMSG